MITSDDAIGLPQIWNTTFYDIPGITEISTAPLDACNVATDRACDTGQIEGHYGNAPYSNYAAGIQWIKKT